jgi:hypothetical protein
MRNGKKKMKNFNCIARFSNWRMKRKKFPIFIKFNFIGFLGFFQSKSIFLLLSFNLKILKTKIWKLFRKEKLMKRKQCEIKLKFIFVSSSKSRGKIKIFIMKFN